LSILSENMKISAFVGHSFTKEDEPLVFEIIRCLNAVENAIEGFAWDHALEAAPIEVQDKVLAKMDGKNLLIAICSAKEHVFDRKSFWKIPFSKNILISSDAVQTKTSDWIIQEIGVAIGRGMQVIVLQERGVRKPGNFQGNVEFIDFDRNNFSEILTKLIQMVRFIKPKAVSDLATVEYNEDARSPVDEKITAEMIALREIPEEKWTKDTFFEYTFNAIYKKDWAAVTDANERFSRSKFGSTDEERAAFKASEIGTDCFIHESDRITELKRLAERYPENERILYNLASCFDQLKQPEEASKIFLKLSTLKEPNVTYMIQAADCLIRVGKLESAREQLIEIKNQKKLTSEDKEKILKLIASIEDANSNSLLYCAAAEGALSINSDDHNLRFNLALKYGTYGLNKNSLTHYNTLKRKNPTEACYNNLGVAYKNLGLEGLAVDAYLESQNLGGTTAVGNLAGKLVAEGFYNQAEDLCKKALLLPEFDDNVPKVLSDLRQRKKRESDDENAAAIEAIDVINFLKESADLCMKADVPEGIAILKLGEHEGPINFKAGKISGLFSCEVEDKGLASFLTFSSGKKVKQVEIEIRGSYWGKSAFIEKTINPIPRRETPSIVENKRIYLVNFNDSLSLAKIYEKNKKQVETIEISQLKLAGISEKASIEHDTSSIP
jgi:tetratricopeptide (TPR) repeat protein